MKQLSFILFTTFLTFMGFSIIIPVVPFLVQQHIGENQHGVVALYVGFLISVYALCQFFGAPVLGALSDRFGRRPILLVSLLGSIIGYLLFALGGSIWILFLGRIIDGLTGGNISTLYAYMADITEPKDRGKYFGWLGAAGGVGFMIGPAIGGVIAHFSLVAPLYFAAAITLANMVWGYVILPESLRHEHKISKLNWEHMNPFNQFKTIIGIKVLRRLFISGAIFFLALSMLQGNASVFFKDVFSWDVTHIGWILFLVGLIDIVSMGFLVPKLLPLWGDEKVAIVGLVLCAVGFMMEGSTSVLPIPFLLYVSVIMVTLGDGFFEPSFAGLISNVVSPSMQGRIHGTNQGMQSLTRIAGPLLAAWLYQYAYGLPFVSESILVILCLVLLVISVPQKVKETYA